MIRHASAQPHAVDALPIATVEPARVAALMPHSRRSCADAADVFDGDAGFVLLVVDGMGGDQQIAPL